MIEDYILMNEAHVPFTSIVYNDKAYIKHKETYNFYSLFYNLWKIEF